MSDLKRDLGREAQEKLKPTPEDLIPIILEGDMKKTALDFAAYLRTSKNKLAWYARNAWQVKHKNEILCGMSVGGQGWWGGYDSKRFWFIRYNLVHMSEYEEIIQSEGLQSIIWDNVVYCNGCPTSSGEKRASPKECTGGKSRTVLGREINGLCHWRSIWNTLVWDPGEATINGIKRLLELEKKARDEVDTGKRDNENVRTKE